MTQLESQPVSVGLDLILLVGYVLPPLGLIFQLPWPICIILAGFYWCVPVVVHRHSTVID